MERDSGSELVVRKHRAIDAVIDSDAGGGQQRRGHDWNKHRSFPLMPLGKRGAGAHAAPDPHPLARGAGPVSESRSASEGLTACVAALFVLHRWRGASDRSTTKKRTRRPWSGPLRIRHIVVLFAEQDHVRVAFFSRYPAGRKR